MKVLILINKVGLGDCIIHLNYIHEISKKYEKPVSILAKENTRAKDLFQDDPHIKEVIRLDRLEDNTGSHDGLNGFIKLTKDIKKKRFDKVFIFNSSVRYFLVCKLAGIRKIAQYPLFKKMGFGKNDCPNTENFFNNMISFPFHIWMSEKQFNYMISSVRKVLIDLKKYR